MKNILLIILVISFMPVKTAFAEMYSQSLYLGYSEEELAEKLKEDQANKTIVNNVTNNTYNYNVPVTYPSVPNYQLYPYNPKYPYGNFMIIRNHNYRPHFPPSLNKPQNPPPVATRPTPSKPKGYNFTGFAYNYGHSSSI